MKMGEPDQRSEPLPLGASPRSGKPPPVATRWKPGQSGNPGGRPKGESIVSLLRKVLEQEHNGKALKELVAERIVKEALSGKHAFVKEMLDRLEGPVGQTHKVEVGPLTFAELSAQLAKLPEDELIGAAIRLGRVELLPPALRDKARLLEKERHG
jgi:hypothetical protein